LVYTRLIPPGAADTVHYRLQIPKDAGNTIRLQARLCYRKFSWYYTHFSYAGVPDAAAASLAARLTGTASETPLPAQPSMTTADYDDRSFSFKGDISIVSGKMKTMPDLPAFVVSENQVTVNVLPANAPPVPPKVQLQGDDWTRWNDYGIGLFLQGDLKGARQAFEQITKIDAKNPDGWVNLGRVAVQEGDMDHARVVLQKALELKPDLARANYFYARVLRTDGKYDEAADRLHKVLMQYPRDRVARNDLGRVLFLQRKYSDAVAELQQVLSIDPEDLQAHYNLMLCYQGLGQAEKAQQEQKVYLRFKADESAQALTGAYRQLHPEDNNERQPIHEHESVTLAPVASPGTAHRSASVSSTYSDTGNK
jgi:Flp pilus assembly protein TadD